MPSECCAGVVGVDVHLERASDRRRRAVSRRAARARARAHRRRARHPRPRRRCSSGTATAPGASPRSASSVRSSTGASGSGSPVTPASRPRMISSSPAPPASTTPASLSTDSRSGVPARASSPRATTRLQELDLREAADVGLLRLVRHLADDGQHRPLDRPAHGTVGGVARRAEGARDARGRRPLRAGEHLGEAADDLAEDDAGVATGSHQRSTRELLGDRLGAHRVRCLERLDDRAHGERQVRAGVAVRDRVHVQVVDPTAGAPRGWRARRRASSRARSMSVTRHASHPRCAPRRRRQGGRSAASPRRRRA